MISTQRLLAIVIGINLIMSLIMTMYYDIDNLNTDSLTSITNVLSGYETQANDEDLGWYGNAKKWVADNFAETTVGNTILYGIFILKLMINALNPFPFYYAQYDTLIEQAAVIILGLFRGIFWIILLVQAYVLFKNKGQK